MIDTIIWSRDRACQLDLLLRSQQRFMPFIHRTYVIWRATGPKFAAAYQGLISRFNGISFIEEGDFGRDLREILDRVEAPLILGNSDDNVFINPVPDVIGAEHFGRSIAAFSLRLNPGVTFCQPAGLSLTPPEFMSLGMDGGALQVWDWTKSDPRGCWGYPHPIDSNIYARGVLRSLIAWGQFHNPRTCELWMDQHRRKDRPHMMCFPETKLVNICNNRVQDGSVNPAGEQSVDFLNEIYLSGKQIRLEPFIGMPVTQCHVVKDYEFEEWK